MAIPSPTLPSSITAVSAVRLSPTQNNKSFYCYSGEITVDTSETTMISVNDIGKRDIFIAFEIACADASGISTQVKVKSNGTIIQHIAGEPLNRGISLGFDELRFILPANTSIEVTIQQASGSDIWTVAAYGTYLEGMR